MGLGRYVVDAVVLEGRSPTELARSHGLSRSWINELVARFRQGGYPELEPGPRRHRSCPHEGGREVQAAVLELRQELITAGHDAGALTIARLLAGRVDRFPWRAPIWRILSRQGLIVPEPHKRPRSSFKRFEAELPNEMWQADATHWLLADGSEVEILNLIDDHSRLVLASVSFSTIKAADVVQTFHEAAEAYGFPAMWLTDNAAVFSGESRRGKVIIETELERLGIRCIHSTPYHPQTCGKVERFHQTLKRYLTKQAVPQSLIHLTLDPSRYYQRIGGRTLVRDVVRHVSAMS